MTYDAAIHGPYKDAYDFYTESEPHLASDWIDRLKAEFYDRGNAVGTAALWAWGRCAGRRVLF